MARSQAFAENDLKASSERRRHSDASCTLYASDSLPMTAISSIATAPRSAPFVSSFSTSPEALREHPARVFLDSQSIITGTKVLSLDFAFVKPMQPGEVTMEGDAIVLPGEGGGIDNLTVALGRVAAKLEQIPFDDIGKNLDLTLKSVQTTIGGEDMQNAVHQLSLTMNDVHKLVKDADNGLTPALARLPAIADQLQQAVANANQAFSGSGYGANSDFQRNATRLMQQVSEAMRSLRLLADFLDRHPEALLRGRSDGAGK